MLAIYDRVGPFASFDDFVSTGAFFGRVLDAVVECTRTRTGGESFQEAFNEYYHLTPQVLEGQPAPLTYEQYIAHHDEAYPPATFLLHHRLYRAYRSWGPEACVGLGTVYEEGTRYWTLLYAAKVSKPRPSNTAVCT